MWRLIRYFFAGFILIFAEARQIWIQLQPASLLVGSNFGYIFENTVLQTDLFLIKRVINFLIISVGVQRTISAL
jgi:hypothetical protein